MAHPLEISINFICDNRCGNKTKTIRPVHYLTLTSRLCPTGLKQQQWQCCKNHQGKQFSNSSLIPLTRDIETKQNRDNDGQQSSQVRCRAVEVFSLTDSSRNVTAPFLLLPAFESNRDEKIDLSSLVLLPFNHFTQAMLGG